MTEPDGFWERAMTRGRITTDYCWLGEHGRCGGQVNTPMPHGCECQCHVASIPEPDVSSTG